MPKFYDVTVRRHYEMDVVIRVKGSSLDDVRDLWNQGLLDPIVAKAAESDNFQLVHLDNDFDDLWEVEESEHQFQFNREDIK